MSEKYNTGRRRRRTGAKEDKLQSPIKFTNKQENIDANEFD